MPTVSVIIPSYNHEKYIGECIQSVLNQTYQDFEIVITDDGSQDKTVENIHQFNDPRIKLLIHDKNKGTSVATNTCINNSSGEFIACLGSDDAWVPEKLEKQVRFLEKNLNVGAVFTREIAIDQNNNRVNQNIYSNVFDQALQNHSQEEWTRFFFFLGNCLCAPSSMIRRNIFDEVGLFDERLAGLQDLDMWVKICLRHNIHLIDDRLTLYRTHDDYSNLSADTSENNTRNIFEYKQILNNYLQIKDIEFFKKAFPEFGKYGELEPMTLPYFLGRIALDTNRNFQRQWGIETIYNFLGNGESANSLEKDCGFSYVDYFNLAKKTMGEDVYLRTQLTESQAQLAEKEQAVQVLSEQAMEKEQAVQVLSEQVAEKEQSVQALTAQVMEKDQKLNSLSQQLNEILISKAWRFALFLRNLRVKLLPPGSRCSNLNRLAYRALKVWRDEGSGAMLRRIRDRLMRTAGATFPASSLYNWWVLNNEPDQNGLAEQREASRQFQYRPLISIITPVYKTPIKILNAAIQSVIEQTYDNLELCIANGSPEVADLRTALDSHARQDPRIKIVHLESNLGIAGNTNAALGLATGDFVGFLDHDDLLAPFALFEVVKVVSENPAVDMIYSDEDKITTDGRMRHTPFFKPAFSPDFLEANNYMPHFLVVRRKIGDELGWIRDGFEGSQDYDLVLRVSEKAREIAHVPQVLYHWRAWSGSTALNEGAKSGSSESGIKALEEHLHRMDIDGTVHIGPWPNTYRVTRSLTATPLVSIIIPNKDHADDLRRCIHSILEKSSYKHFEIIIVENNSQEDATLLLYKELQQYANVRVIQYENQHKNQPFNYSLVNNYGAGHANGDILLLLNNDLSVITPDWLERMLEYILRPEVGIVGAKLYYPDDTVQHGGVIVGLGGVAGHAHYHYPRTEPGYFCRLILPQNLSAVTGACLMIKKDVYEKVNGLDPDYRLAFGDIDLCMKVLNMGYLIVWTPYSELYHDESKTRGIEDTPEKIARFVAEIDRFKQKWSGFLERGDDYYNPNLTLGRENFDVNIEPVNVSTRIKPGFLKGVNK